jgi:OmcA/MtrC family decaheme c-type cytochrome
MDIMYRKGWLTLKYCFYVLVLLGLFLTLGGGCGNGGGGGGEGPIPPPTAENKLNVQITSVTIPTDNKPVVTFRITDDQGNPIDRKAAGVNMRFIIARIPRGEDEYSNYITLVQKSSITGQSAVQADSEGSSANPLGTFSDQGNGVSTYTFNTALPEGYDKNVTHTVGIFATATIQGRVYVSNATFNFIPSGGEVTTVRDVVRTENCNSCHDPLEAHGGARRDVKLCVLCHSTEIIDPKTGQSVEQVDPDTGNNIGFPVLIHKIHRGEDLPSVRIAGKPYQIIGFRGSVNDFSNVVFRRI